MYHTAFKKDPMDRRNGLRYRYVVLEKGGSQDEMEMLEEFLGRKPDATAFSIDLGLSGRTR